MGVHQLGTNGATPFSTLQLGTGASRTAMTGTDRYFLDLVRALPGVGVTVHGLMVGEPQALDDPVPNVTSFSPSDASRLHRWSGERRAVRELVRKCDVVVSHWARATFPVLDLVRGLPLIHQFHGPWALEAKAEGKGHAVYYKRRLLESLTYRRADRFVVLSHAFGDILSRQYKVSWERIRVIPGGVTVGRFESLPTSHEARERLGWPGDRPIIATVRRLVPSKGIDRLIDAIADVRRYVPDVFCAIVGTGPLASDLQRRIDERGLGAHVRLVGFVPDAALKFVYRAADLFVVPTIAFEGFGMVVLESLACGTPALVTPIGGLSEAVSGLSSTLVLASSSVDDIAAGITQGLSGSGDLPTGEACMQYARGFDWNIIAARVSEVYREVL